MKNYCGIAHHSEHCDCINGGPIIIDGMTISAAGAISEFAEQARLLNSHIRESQELIEALKQNDEKRFYRENGTGKVRMKPTNYTPKKKKRK